ncbi:hypothetical protein OPIT5_27365 [Opitutaceae bacterium TAV5]|nr:hypothetical protein OPIT5_27365 [Opitutaceae bacterium TAV5]
MTTRPDHLPQTLLWGAVDMILRHRRYGLVMRRLGQGPRERAELSRRIPGMTAFGLLQLLRVLEQTGLVDSVEPVPGCSGKRHGLTPRGHGLNTLLDVVRGIDAVIASSPRATVRVMARQRGPGNRKPVATAGASLLRKVIRHRGAREILLWITLDPFTWETLRADLRRRHPACLRDALRFLVRCRLLSQTRVRPGHPCRYRITELGMHIQGFIEQTTDLARAPVGETFPEETTFL